MPELPDVTVYVERLAAHLVGQRVTACRLPKPFLVRSFDPPLDAAIAKRVQGFSRIGKRIVFELEEDAVQRIVYADNECNYCPRCQTEGRLLADRALSRLLTKDFPRTIADLEELAASRTRDV